MQIDEKEVIFIGALYYRHVVVDGLSFYFGPFASYADLVLQFVVLVKMLGDGTKPAEVMSHVYPGPTA